MVVSSTGARLPALRSAAALTRRVRARVRLDPNIRTSVHHTFFMLGDDLRADAVDRGFYPHETFTRHAWLDPLRNCRCKEAVYEGAFGTPETVRGYGLCLY